MHDDCGLANGRDFGFARKENYNEMLSHRFNT